MPSAVYFTAYQYSQGKQYREEWHREHSYPIKIQWDCLPQERRDKWTREALGLKEEE